MRNKVELNVVLLPDPLLRGALVGLGTRLIEEKIDWLGVVIVKSSSAEVRQLHV